MDTTAKNWCPHTVLYYSPVTLNLHTPIATIHLLVALWADEKTIMVLFLSSSPLLPSTLLSFPLPSPLFLTALPSSPLLVSFSQELGEITSIDVKPCDQDPCILKLGSNETVTVNFIPHEVVTSAEINAYAIFGSDRIPLPVPDRDACQGHGLTCPLKSDVPVEFMYTIYLSPDFPSGIKLQLKVEFIIKTITL